jgi:hypothetical protein
MRIFRFLLVAAFITVGWTGGATAFPITFDFTADVTFVDPGLASFFSVGETLTGSYTFESTTPGVPSGPTADYPALTAFSVSGLNFSGSWTGGSIFVQDASTDEYFVSALTGFIGTNAGLGVLPTAGISMFDSTGTMLSSMLLPLVPPSLPADPRFVVDYHLGPETREDALATLTSLTLVPSPAPEPTTLALFGIALAGIALSYLRKRNQVILLLRGGALTRPSRR